MKSYVLTKMKGTVNRVPIGGEPESVEVRLEDNQEIVSFKWKMPIFSSRTRTTEDWTWEAYISTRKEA